MSLQALAGLALALLLSIGGNAVLGWKLAKAGEKCRADMVEAAKIAIENERKRADTAESEAVAITTTTAAATTAATRNAQGKTHARDQAIRSVDATGGCRMPDGLPSLQPAIDEANAAAGI